MDIIRAIFESWAIHLLPQIYQNIQINMTINAWPTFLKTLLKVVIVCCFSFQRWNVCKYEFYNTNIHKNIPLN